MGGSAIGVGGGRNILGGSGVIEGVGIYAKQSQGIM